MDMNFNLSETFQLLERTPGVLNELVRGPSPFWSTVNEGPGTWNVVDVVGHLIHGEETDWIPRAETILSYGIEKPFVPFDRFAQIGRFNDWTLDNLLDRFEVLRGESLATARGWDLNKEQLLKEGIHPEFGRVSLKQLLSTWAVHDLTHLSQITRVMANHYSEDVGPWKAYLSILK